MRRLRATATIANRAEPTPRAEPQSRRRGSLHRSYCLAAVRALSFCGLTTNATFAQSPPTWQVRFTAPAACPGEEDFRRALDARAARAHASSASAQLVIVSIRASDGGWTGRLEVESRADGVRVERAAHARRCEDLVPALALMTALALELEPAPTSGAASDRPTVDGHDSASTSYPAHLDGAPAPVEISPEPSTRTTPLSEAPRRSEGELGFLLHWRSVVGWRDRVAVAPGIVWGSRARRGFAPWLRVSGDYVASQVVTADSGLGASLTWALAQADACTHKWALWGSAFVSPCARLSVGALQAKGNSAVDTPRELTRLWLSAGGGAEAAIPLFGPLWLRVQGGVEALVLRHRVYVDADPDRVLIEMPAALAQLGLGLGVRIW